MKLNIYKAEEVAPPIGKYVIIWECSPDTGEVWYRGLDMVVKIDMDITMDIAEDDLADCLAVEKRLTEDGFLLGIGWEDTGEFVHKDDYWSIPQVD